MKLLDYSGLQRFLAKIKTLLDSKANAQHTHSTSDVTDLLSDQHTWSSQQSYNADLNLNYSSTDVDDIIDTIAGSYTAEDFLAQNNVWTGSNTFTADVSLQGGIYAQNYYLGTTAFGDIVTHNASEFSVSGHTHTKSQITDFPTKTSQFTNDSHQTITVGTDTTSTATPAHSGTFTCIDSVTRDSNGHVTAVNTKTVTLPADNNTDTKVTNTLGTTTKAYVTGTTSATTNTGTQIFDTGVYLSTTAGELVANKFTGTLNGNANTATQFSANKDVTLTGDVTGTASSKAGWSVATTLSDSGVTAGTYGPSADVTGNNNATISVPEITVDSKGRVTSVANRTLTCKNNTYNVYNKTLTIQKNGTNVATFTSNSNTDVTANITVPTKVSELDNDSGFLTSHQSLSNYVTLDGTQAITGSKDFSNSSFLTVRGYRFRVKNDSMILGTVPSSSQWTGMQFTDKNDNPISEIVQSFQSNGNSLYQINVFPNEANSEKRSVISYAYNSTNNANNVTLSSNLIPNSNSTYDIGTLTNRWRGTYSQEYHAYNANAFMAKTGDYTFLIRNDGGSTYFLMSAKNGNEGTWTNARPLTINNAAGICDINGSCGGTSHGLLSSLNQYGDSVTYTEGQLTVGTASGNAYKGSSNNAALISFPENGTFFTDTATNVQNLRLAWAGDWKYWHDIFVSPNNNYIWHRDVVNGGAKPWRRVVEENATGLTNQTWSINIGGTSANVTGTVAIANGGTGATSRTSAVSNLFNANIGSSPSHFLTGTSNFGNSGYSSVADVKTALGLSNYVTLGDAQTISGNKTFTGTNTFTAGNLYHTAEDPSYVLKSSTMQEGVVPSGNKTAYAGYWMDKNSNILGYDRFVFYSTGLQTYEVNVRNKATNGSFSTSGSQIQSGYQLALHPNGNSELKIYAHTLPNGNNTWNLGDSTHKWKALNGVNPGALFLPKISSKVSLSERLTDLTGQTSLRYTPPYNGWISIETDNTSSSNFIRCSYDNILVKTDGNAKQSGISILCPVLAGVEVRIYVKCVTLTSAFFYPSLGDVNVPA